MLCCHKANKLAEVELLIPVSSCSPAAEHNQPLDSKLQISVLKMKVSPKIAKNCGQRNLIKPRTGSLRQLWQLSSSGINKNEAVLLRNCHQGKDCVPI